MSDQIEPTKAAFSPQAEITSAHNLAAPKICHNMQCGFETHEKITKCPKCGRPMWTSVEFKVISCVIVVAGLFLSGLGGGLGYIAYRNLAPGGGLPEGYELGVVILTAIAGFIFLFGLTAIAAGVWQMLFGRANRRLIFILFLFPIVLFFVIVFGRLILTLLSEF